MSNLEPRTIRDREQYWKELGKAFGQIPMDKLEPTWMLGYFEKRSAKTSAKKEIKFLSTLCNWARARGYMHIPNPVTGTTRQMPVSENRTIYVTNEEYALVSEEPPRRFHPLLFLLVSARFRPEVAELKPLKGYATLPRTLLGRILSLSETITEGAKLA